MHHSDDDTDLCQTEDDDDINVHESYIDDELVEIEDKELIAELRREGRKHNADDFRREYIYGPSIEEKTFVWPGGTHSWMDPASPYSKLRESFGPLAIASRSLSVLLP